MQMNTILAAFTGAFFAFLFMRLSEMLNKIYKRQAKNFNTLVKLEYFCSEKVDTIALNIWFIDDFVSVFAEALKNNHALIYNNKLYVVSFPEDLLLNLSNIDFINRVLHLKISFSRANNDIEMLNGLCADLASNLINKNIDFPAYKANMLDVLEKLKGFKKHLQALEKETNEVAAGARVLENQKPVFIRIEHFLCAKKMETKKFQKLLAKETAKVEAERKQVTEQSKKDLAAIEA